MAHDHQHHDFICRACGALVTCLSCLEIRAAELPRGPAFTAERYGVQPPPQPPVFETIVTNEFEVIEPDKTGLNQCRLSAALTELQQSLFA